MRTLRAAAATLVTALALSTTLSACSDDSQDPNDPTSTSTPSGTTATPSSTPTAKPTEPPLPDAAKKATEAGARAFLTYYWDLVNYAQLTGDVRALNRISGSTCGGCQRAIKAINDLYEGGGHATGGEYALRIDRIKEVSPADRSLLGIEAAIQVRNAEQLIVRGTGKEETSRPRTSRFLTYLIWADDAWRADVLEPR